MSVFFSTVAHAANGPTSSTLSAQPAIPYTPVAPADLDPLLDQISSRLGAVRGFESRFIQERHLAIFEEPLIGKGICYFSAPDKFRWELFDPYVSVLIFNRDGVGKFEGAGGRLQPIKSDAYKALSEALGQMTGLMRGDFKASRASFTISARRGEFCQLILTPRAKAMTEYIKAIELYMNNDNYQVSRIVIREPENDTIEIEFSRVRENPSLDANLFNLNNPLYTPVHDESGK